MTRHPDTTTMLAVTALEGWEPSGVDDDEILDLVDVDAPARVIRARVLAGLPAVATRRPPSRILGRRRPYLVRGTRVLENSLAVTSAADLHRAEALLVAAAGVRVLRGHHLPGTVSGVHAALFGDVYAWAGLPRIVEVSKPGSSFVPAHRVPALLSSVERPVLAVESALADAPPGADRRRVVATALGRWYAHLNHVHPFREGNGRAAAVAALLAARAHGVDLDFRRTDRRSWVAAAIGSMPRPPRRTVDTAAHVHEFLRITVGRRGAVSAA